MGWCLRIENKIKINRNDIESSINNEEKIKKIIGYVQVILNSISYYDDLSKLITDRLNEYIYTKDINIGDLEDEPEAECVRHLLYFVYQVVEKGIYDTD